jgi:hypothetical protein
MPVVPSYGGSDEYSLQQRQLTYQPTRGAWPPAAPRGLRPIGGNVFGGVRNSTVSFAAQPPGYSGSAITGYNDLLTQSLMGMNGGGFAQR